MKHHFPILPTLLLCTLFVQFSLEIRSIKEEDIVPHKRLDQENVKNQQEIVAAHNDARKRVTPSAANMLRMVWSNELSKLAHKLVKNCSMDHSPPNKRKIRETVCGENIMIAPEPLSWTDCVKRWEEENENFKYGVGAINNETTGHFTQLVSDNTFSVGCAYANCTKDGKTYQFYLCIYYTPGNLPHKLQTPYIAGEPCSKCPKDCDEEKLCTNFCMHTNNLSNCQQYLDRDTCNYRTVKNEYCPADCQCAGKIY